MLPLPFALSISGTLFRHLSTNRFTKHERNQSDRERSAPDLNTRRRWFAVSLRRRRQISLPWGKQQESRVPSVGTQEWRETSLSADMRLSLGDLNGRHVKQCFDAPLQVFPREA